MIVVEYLIFITIITLMTIFAIWLVLHLKSEIDMLRKEITEVKNEMMQTQTLFRNQITKLLEDVGGVALGNINKVLGK